MNVKSHNFGAATKADFDSARAAERALEGRAMLLLTARETEAFAKAILNPAEPGPAIRKAAREYLQKLRGS